MDKLPDICIGQEHTCACLTCMHGFQVVREGGNEDYLHCNLEQRGLQRYAGQCVSALQFMMTQFQRDCNATLLLGITQANCNVQVLQFLQHRLLS